MNTIQTEEPSTDITEIILDRPDKRNAINEQMREELTETLAAVSTPVVLLRGNAGTFCAGEDVDEVSTSRSMNDHTQDLITTLETLRTADPVTAACIEGYALGGGMFLAAACDLRIGVTGSQYGVPVLELGIPPAGGGTKLLLDLLDGGTVRKLVFSADIVDCDTATDIGFLQWTCPDVQAARSICRDIADYDPEALKATKAYINACENASSLPDVAEFEGAFMTDRTPDLNYRQNDT